MSLRQYRARNYVIQLRSVAITRFRKSTTSRFTVTKPRRLPGMTDDLSHEPLFSNPKRLLLDMAQEQSLAELLRMIVARLSDSHRIALVRIWLAQPTTGCTGCPIIDACREQSHCLHLVASG